MNPNKPRNRTATVTPGLVIHFEQGTPLTDITENLSTCVHALPALDEHRLLRDTPIIIETPNVEFAHTIYRYVRFVVQEMARRRDRERSEAEGRNE